MENKKTTSSNSVGGIFKTLFATAVANNIAATILRTKGTMRDRIRWFVARVVRNIILSFLGLVGVIFILVGLVQVLPSVTGMSLGAAYLIIGLGVLLISSLFFTNGERKNK